MIKMRSKTSGQKEARLGGVDDLSFFSQVYQGRRVLVTGHTGFKGSWLSMWLVHLGAEVAGFSLDVPTTPSNFELTGVGNRAKDYRGDIRDRKRLCEVIDEFRPEVIFHLAAQSLVRRSYADPIVTMETNVMGMANLLDCMRSRSWIEMAVLITSDKVYRNDEWCWGYRETDILGGHDPYSGSKSCAELVAHSFFHSFLQDGRTRMVTARAGNVIGGGDWAEDRIVPDCVRAWSKGRAVTIRNPKARRPWQHVLEPLSGYLWLGASLWKEVGELNGESFNFGPDSEVNQSVVELLGAMSSRWPGGKWQIPNDADQRGHEATLLKLCCDKASHYLDWRAVLRFPETVAFTIDWYRTWHERSEDLYAYTINQIDKFCDLAQARHLPWIQLSKLPPE